MVNNNEVNGTECGNRKKEPYREMVRYTDIFQNIKDGYSGVTSSEYNISPSNPQEATQVSVPESRLSHSDTGLLLTGVGSNQCTSSCPNEYEEMYKREQLKRMNAHTELSIALAKKEALHRQQIEQDANRKYAEMVMKEMAEEHRKGQYEDIVFAPDGTIQCKTMGTFIETETRYIVNIKFPKLFILENTSGESGYYELDFEIGGNPKKIYLDANKCDSGKYLLKKLMKAGVVFKSNKKATQIDYVERIWAALLNYEPKRITIAAHTGWVKIGEHQYEFVEEGRLVWDQVIKLAL